MILFTTHLTGLSIAVPVICAKAFECLATPGDIKSIAQYMKEQIKLVHFADAEDIVDPDREDIGVLDLSSLHTDLVR